MRYNIAKQLTPYFFMISQTLKRLVSSTLITIMAATFFGMTSVALAQTNTIAPPANNSSIFGSSEDDLIGTGGKDGKTFVKDILKYFLGFLGLLCVVMIIYGGFLYITSAGEEEGAKKGKTIILYCVIGLLIIAGSYIIVDTVLKGITAASS